MKKIDDNKINYYYYSLNRMCKPDLLTGHFTSKNQYVNLDYWTYGFSLGGHVQLKFF